MLTYSPSFINSWLPPSLQFNPSEASDRLRYFAYGAQFLPIAVNGTNTQTVTIQADSAFLWLQLNRIITDVTNTTFFPAAPLLITLTQTGSGAQFTDVAQHIDALFGDAQDPGTPPVPLFLPPASTLQLTIGNLSAVTAFNVRISLLGVRVKI